MRDALAQAERTELERAITVKATEVEIAVLRDALAQAERERTTAAEAMRNETAALCERLSQAERAMPSGLRRMALHRLLRRFRSSTTPLGQTDQRIS